MLETLTFGLKFNQSLEGRGSEQQPELDSMSNSDPEVTQTNIGCQFFLLNTSSLAQYIFRLQELEVFGPKLSKFMME